MTYNVSYGRLKPGVEVLVVKEGESSSDEV